jgi:hypothetical protein
MTAIAADEQPLVPTFFLDGFTDAEGRLMAERRDRTRRRLLSAAAAAAELGTYRLAPSSPGAAALAALLRESETTAAAAVHRIVAGTFPPSDGDRRCLALVLALQVLLGRAHRAQSSHVTELLGQLILSGVENGDTDAEESPPESGGPEDAGALAVGGLEGDTVGSAPEAILSGPRPERRSLAWLLEIARQLTVRTWQVVRFPAPVLLTSDTPAVLWAPSAASSPYRTGLGAADEVRVPLDSRHALVVARRARAGEIVRDLGERHARALNRTVAEAATEWMYYDPASDPLEGVALRRAESD